jgi:hypothetical protein
MAVARETGTKGNFIMGNKVCPVRWPPDAVHEI